MEIKYRKSLVNGQASESISVQDRGLHYGDGIFKTIAVSSGEPLALEEHMLRLFTSAKVLGFPEIDTTQFFDEIYQVAHDASKSILKVILTRGAGDRGYRYLGLKITPTRIVSCYPWPMDYTAELYQRGLSLRLCQTRLTANRQLAGIKHLNRIEQVLAKSEWDDPEIQEGLMLDFDDNVIEGCMSNVFMIRDRRLMTPSLDRCGIHGIIRRLVLNGAAEIGLDSQITQLSISDFLSADEVFVCNSVLGICHVRQLLQQKYRQFTYMEKIRNFLIENKKIISP